MHVSLARHPIRYLIPLESSLYHYLFHVILLVVSLRACFEFLSFAEHLPKPRSFRVICGHSCGPPEALGGLKIL